ncbi:MAG: YitT family protein [Lachnospiraceae bacterium]|nr:YitT family protein [Lachnospiraceae bacterium]
MKVEVKVILKKVFGIIIGSFINACGISLFLDPNNLAPGGLIGIAVILNRMTGLETGTLFFLLNIPIVMLGLWRFGYRFITTTFFAVVINSIFTNYTTRFGVVTTDPLLASLAGSILVGVGIGIVFRSGATTGGIDIIIKILREKYKHLKTGFLFLILDVIIVAISGFVFRDFNIIMYALIAVVVSGQVMDYVLYGRDEAKLMYVISDKADLIADRILDELDVGATFLQGQGAYTGAEKKVIMCVVKKNQGPKLEEIVKQEDKAAFLIISSANEIYGEGYKNILNEKI